MAEPRPWNQHSVSARHASTKFWCQLTLAVSGTALLIGTLAWPGWIEMAFHIDPDQGSGWLEWAIVIVAFTLVLTCSAGARRQGWAARPTAVRDGAS